MSEPVKNSCPTDSVSVLQKIANLTAWDACIIFARDKSGNLFRYCYGVEIAGPLDEISLSIAKQMHKGDIA